MIKKVPSLIFYIILECMKHSLNNRKDKASQVRKQWYFPWAIVHRKMPAWHVKSFLLFSKKLDLSNQIVSTIADARNQEENPMRKKCLKAIVQEGHNTCTSEWQMLSAILKANTV